jgi:adenylosuccinate synthase
VLYGDEGKGMVVDYLCQNSKRPLVVRYCGGQQAGHQVVMDDHSHHVFSNFGSGTLRGIPTYWSPYCTIDPIGIINELVELVNSGYFPELYIDGKCPVTTPFEVFSNKDLEKVYKHGSCGLGINATYRREEAMYSLLFEDIFFNTVFNQKLDLFRKHYGIWVNDEAIHHFKQACYVLRDNQCVKIAPHDLNKARNGKTIESIVFEGSQGLLLDQHNGFFPHVTPSNTGSKNFLRLGATPKPWVVTRAYHTRHGNGPFSTEQFPHNIKSNPWEQNFDDTAQGVFRTGLLDLDLLKYGIFKDDYLRYNSFNLVITCLDLITDEYRYIQEEKIIYCMDEEQFIDRIVKSLKKQGFKVDEVFLSHSPIASQLKKWRQ